MVNNPCARSALHRLPPVAQGPSFWGLPRPPALCPCVSTSPGVSLVLFRGRNEFCLTCAGLRPAEWESTLREPPFPAEDVGGETQCTCPATVVHGGQASTPAGGAVTLT